MIALLAAVLTMSSCRGMPAGLENRIDFQLDNKILDDMAASFQKVNTDNYYIRKTGLSSDYDLQASMQGNDLIWYEWDETERAYQDGVIYEYNHQTKQTSQTETLSVKNPVEADIKFAKALLLYILECDDRMFTVEEASETLVGDKPSHIALAFHGRQSEMADLCEQMPGLDWNEIFVNVNRKDQSDEYDYFIIQWHTDQMDYWVLFDSYDYIDGLKRNINAVKNGHNSNSC